MMEMKSVIQTVADAGVTVSELAALTVELL